MVSRPTGPERLAASLEVMNFQRVESLLADETAEQYGLRIKRLVENWDEELHRQMVEFLTEGGFEAEKKMAVVQLAEAEQKRREREEIAQIVAATPEKRGKGKRPLPAATIPGLAVPATEQSLDGVVEAEVLAADPRLGAW